jgi:3-deoxy-D-manno-octulosonate 8-phosphate phosphatase (KDO 8-P phosphatase)
MLKNKIPVEKINAIILDIDGVLTDGTIAYDADGREIKYFNARDGHGIKLAMRAGLKVGLLSGRESQANKKRAAELGLDFIYENIKDKKTGFLKLLEEHDLKPEECLFVGDDLVDIPPMKMAGMAATVADAPEFLDQFCDYRSTLPGGRGAVREIIELILKEQNKWKQVTEKYFR